MPTRKTSDPDVPGRRTPLSRERIAAAALRLIDRKGLEDLSTRKLASALRCEAMSIYHHVNGKAHLLDAVAELLLLEVEIEPAGAGTWLERLERASHSYRNIALRHPNAFILLATRRFNTPTMLSVFDRLLGIFREGGFDAAMSARMFRIHGHYLNGAAMAAISVRHGTPDPPKHLMLERPPDLANYPNVAEAAPYLGPDHVDVTFQEGLRMLLERIDAAPRRAR